MSRYGFRKKQPAIEALEEPESPAYHGTTRDKLASITLRGLESNERVRNDWGAKRGEDEEHPQTEHLIYYTREPADWGDTLLRFSEDDIPYGAGTDSDKLRPGERYITSDQPFAIPPEALQYQDEKGQWKRLAQEAQARGDE